uniref:Uncharacterized protein n=1 Tax=Aegilops tauschii subsp. strangulata TaxID=200361 RepID=A0A453E000_AEGTS
MELYFSVGPWEMRLQRSLTTKKVLSFCQNCPKRILSWSIRSQFLLTKLETFATMAGTCNPQEVIMPVH